MSYSQLCGHDASSFTGHPSCVWKFPESATLLTESDPRFDAGSNTKRHRCATGGYAKHNVSRPALQAVVRIAPVVVRGEFVLIRRAIRVRRDGECSGELPVRARRQARRRAGRAPIVGTPELGIEGPRDGHRGDGGRGGRRTGNLTLAWACGRTNQLGPRIGAGTDVPE